MKKFLGIIFTACLVSACSPVDSTRTLDQQQTQQLVRNMYPIHTNAKLMAPVTQSK